MMHIGTIIGGSLPSALPWQLYKSDHERRNLAAAGFAAGITVAFGTPIGKLVKRLKVVFIYALCNLSLIINVSDLKVVESL